MTSRGRIPEKSLNKKSNGKFVASRKREELRIEEESALRTKEKSTAKEERGKGDNEKNPLWARDRKVSRRTKKRKKVREGK